ncbi:amidohydrolase family protein [Bifidobacterium longum subsp. longum]|uniref:amidohydrolase family protein n=1 Tax=Bifidobacterium longum TaxID=216816 RepID=UPI000C317EF4|nr:amidohydrolase family protein [Bifidobacterium longum]PKC83128.1 hypothetical protein DPC6323_0283 [Bifidobacterium longum]
MQRIIDSHFHIWDPSVQPLSWLDGTDGSITRRYDMDCLKRAYASYNEHHPDAAVNFIGGVYVEVDTDDTSLEDRLLSENHDPLLLATSMRSTVGPAMRVPLYAHGVREPLHTPTSPRGRCLQNEFIRGLQLMADKNMPFDACVRVDELDDLAQACEQVPEATVIVDHMGNISNLHNLESSSDALHRLGELPNVYVKVSGYPTDDLRFVSTLLDLAQAAFSNKRLLYASNWPVVGLYADFDSHLSILLNRFAGNDDFFLNNARNAYHIVERKKS